MDFRQTMIAFGLNPRDIIADGEWRRCPTDDKPRKRNGAYMLRPSGDRGYFKNYALDDGWHEWRDDKPLAPIQRQQSDREIQAYRERDRKRRMEAIQKMRAYWSGLQSLRDGHPYLDAKGLSMQGCHGLKIDGDLLVIPMMRSGSIISLQTITPSGEKKYRAGCPIKGAAFHLARRGAVLTCLSEGFATGLAIFQAMPESSVVVCFDAGNLLQVAAELRLRGLSVVCADNDWETEKRTGVNPGLSKGRSAAESLGCGLAYPEGIEGSDWADALLEWGEKGAVKVRMEIMRHARPVFG